MKKISDFNSATEKYPVVYAGSATRPEYVDMPTILQQQEGVAPLDTCPAQWWNAMWKLATRDINAFRDYVGDAITEINNLLTEFGITLDDADSEQLYDFFHNDYVQNYLSTIFVSKNGDTIDGDLHIKGDLSVDGIGEEIISTELKVGANTITLRNDNPSALGNTELAGVVTENYDGDEHNNIIAVRKDGEARTGDIDIATRILYSNDGTNFYTDEDLTTPATIGANEEVRNTGNQTSSGVEIYEGITYSNDDTQPLLTRAETNELSNGHYLKWDAVNKRAVDGGSIIDAFYPVGSLYWTGKAPDDGGDPNVLFGGTWVQIKDRFVLAAGDTYANGATGGAATVTLTTAQMPSHRHSYTPSGTVSSHSHKVGAHSHGLNSHTHTIPKHKHGTGTLAASSQSLSASFQIRQGRYESIQPVTNCSVTTVGNPVGVYQIENYNLSKQQVTFSLSHGHSITGSTADSAAELTSGAATGSTANSTEFDSGKTQPTFTGTASSTEYKGGPNGASSGQSSPHENMPPYIVKYCWERTA